MKILHYALGFPPYRTGGLTKFCMDLMEQQCMDGHHVALMWPGRIKTFHHKVLIKDMGMTAIFGKTCKIQSFEIINPLPVPYDEGISEFYSFEKNDGWETYEKLLAIFQPDIIHLHTLMGLHKSFLELARKRDIRCVFTAHDFFPICPKVTMIHQGQICPSAKSCIDCGACNTTALSLRKIRVLQSPLYRLLKDMTVVRRLRIRHRDRYLSGDMEQENKNTSSSGTASDYKKLRNHYYSMLKLIDIIHYNSSVTKAVYESFFHLPNFTIISISHGDISDHRKKKEFIPDKLRMTYLGQQREAKGFFLLQRALDELWKTKKSFSLNIYFTPKRPSTYMKIWGRYSYSELESIFDQTDLLIVPSVWKETFGYVVLEALSYGVPVLISGNVGAKDILAKGAGIIMDEISADTLYHCLNELTSEYLAEMNKIILDKQEIPTLRSMARHIEEECYKVKHS